VCVVAPALRAGAHGGPSRARWKPATGRGRAREDLATRRGTRLAGKVIMATEIRDPDVHKATTPSLFAAVIEDARDLAIGHLERMQRETAGELRNLKRAIARIAVALGIVIVAAVLGGHALALALVALGLPAWVSYAIAAVLGVGAGALLISRLPRDTTDLDLVPEESIAKFRRDVARVKDAATQAT
jgi:ribosomal protein L29